MNNNTGYSIKFFEEKESEHIAFVTKILSKEIMSFENIVNLQSKLFHGYVTVSAIPEYHPTATDSIIIQSHVKSTYLLYNAHKLTLQGNYGIAQSLLRQIFEFQLICKYFHLKNNDDEAEKWLNKSQFDVFDKVLKRLEKPSKIRLSNFWKLLCSQAHATTTSCQVTSDINDNRNEMLGIYYIILILLCIESLSLEYLHKRKNIRHIKRFIGDELYREFIASRRNWINLIKSVINSFTDEGKFLINDFRMEWIFKS